MTMDRAENRKGGESVLHIIPYPLFPLMGPHYRCLRQLHALRDRGMKTALVTPRIGNENDVEKLKGPLFKGITVYPVLPLISPAVMRELGYLFLSRRRIRACIKDFKPTIVQAHNPPD